MESTEHSSEIMESTEHSSKILESTEHKFSDYGEY